VEALGKAEGSGEEAPLAGAGEGAPSLLLPYIRTRRHVSHVVAMIVPESVFARLEPIKDMFYALACSTHGLQVSRSTKGP
jgi:hypothetical protein